MIAQAAAILTAAFLAWGIALWLRAFWAQELVRARRKVDRAVIDSLRSGPRFSHSLSDEVGEAIGAGRAAPGLVRTSVQRLEARGLVRSSESGFIAPRENEGEPEPRRVYELTAVGCVKTRRLTGARGTDGAPKADGAHRA